VVIESLRDLDDVPNLRPFASPGGRVNGSAHAARRARHATILHRAVRAVAGMCPHARRQGRTAPRTTAPPRVSTREDERPPPRRGSRRRVPRRSERRPRPGASTSVSNAPGRRPLRHLTEAIGVHRRDRRISRLAPASGAGSRDFPRPAASARPSTRQAGYSTYVRGFHDLQRRRAHARAV
jgi:hypothetical protein